MIRGLLSKQTELWNKAEKKEEEIRKAEKLKDRYNERARTTDCVIKPLAKAILEKEGWFKYDILGPFGLTSEISIFFWKTEEDYNTYKDRDHPKHDEWSKVTLSISLRMNWGGDEDEFSRYLYAVDHSQKPSQEFADNTIGAVNGFNKKTVEITEWTLDQIVEFMHNQKD